MSVERLAKIIEGSNNIVVLAGRDMTKESGIRVFRDEDVAYDIEMEYGYSPEEIFSAAFFSTRVDLFYDFFKKEILLAAEPTEGHKAIAKLEKMGKIKAVVTRSIYGLDRRAGCENVIELHGSIQQNVCTKCGAVYDADYVKNSLETPVCKKCKLILRPTVALYGDMVDNGLITRASEAVGNAEVLLVIGAHMNSYLCTHFLQYFNGSHIVVINERPDYSDRIADLIVEAKAKDVLPVVLEKITK